MTIQEMVESAYNFFLDQYNGGWGSDPIFERFAKEELKLDEPAISALVEEALYGDGVDPKSSYDFNQFYTWYYINYCVTEKQDES